MFLCCFNLSVLEVLSAPSQLILVSFAFTNLILVASYTASLSVVLSTGTSQTGFSAMADLATGQAKVAAHGVYVDRIYNNYGVRSTPLNWNGEPTFLQVRSGFFRFMLPCHAILPCMRLA